ncbi:EcsC family protein [Tuberibacillus sp. Marseille-P3662]|uniref:EcsC family protein n=1 Tax=Tuberibacillus sp. Marseille-P3662 TaxID=1965358 RepID=UPI000A1CA274|nr:EcsC family protein [Tuberibacillus sp. Marseille-P3662]
MTYEDYARLQCVNWQKKMLKPSWGLGHAAKSIQNKMNEKIPQKVHDIATESIKNMVKTVLFGSEITTRRQPLNGLSLQARETRVREKLKIYKRTASVEGAGTGAGGFWLALADFPMLLSIKMKFLYDVAAIYGYNVRDYSERLYLLHIFQVAFSSEEKRIESVWQLKHWQTTLQAYPSLDNLDWQAFQQEYRDYMDLAKLMQLIPGFGAIVGAVVNYRFLDRLGTTAMNAYRLRILDC